MYGCSYRQYIHICIVCYIPWISKYSHNFCFVSVFFPNAAVCRLTLAIRFLPVSCVAHHLPMVIHEVINLFTLWFSNPRCDWTPYRSKLKREPAKARERLQRPKWTIHFSCFSPYTMLISLKLWCTKYPFYLMLMQSIQLAADSCAILKLKIYMLRSSTSTIPGYRVLFCCCICTMESFEANEPTRFDSFSKKKSASTSTFTCA